MHKEALVRTGSTGSTGSTGPAGTASNTGATGPTGKTALLVLSSGLELRPNTGATGNTAAILTDRSSGPNGSNWFNRINWTNWIYWINRFNWFDWFDWFDWINWSIGVTCPTGDTCPQGVAGTATNTGATGFTGPTGNTGPQGLPGTASNTGATCLSGSAFPINYGYFAGVNLGQSVTSGNPFTFNTSTSGGVMTLTGSNMININATGTYVVSFGVESYSSSGRTIGLNVSGTILPQAQINVACVSGSAEMISATIILNLQSTDTIQLVTAGASTITTYAYCVSAYVTLHQIA